MTSAGGPGSKRVVVSTRTEPAGGEFAVGLRAAGLELWQLPVTEIQPVNTSIESTADAGETAGAPGNVLARLAHYDWVVFTSRHAVDAMWTRQDVREAWAQGLERRPRVAAIGATTIARLRAHGIAVDIMPAEATGTLLAGALLSAHGAASTGFSTIGRPAPRGATLNVLWPCARDARPEMAERLRTAGARVDSWVVYETRAVVPRELPAFIRRLDAGEVGAVCFCAPSAVRALRLALGESGLRRLAATRIVSIGPTTSEALARAGLRPHGQASVASGAALATAVVETLALRGNGVCA